MRTKKAALLCRLAVAFILIMIGVTACEYETIEIDLPDPAEEVSFAADIVPIFTSNNNCTACHGTGGTPPNLTAGSAYASIVPDLVDLSEPASSVIYLTPSPASSVHGFKKYTQAEAALVLLWIEQGAENN